MAVAVLVLLAVRAAAPVAAQSEPVQPGSLGPSATHAYVRHVHDLFLGRSPDATELADLTHVVHAAGPTGLTSRLALSAEWAGVRIDDLYRRILRLFTRV